VKLASAIHQNQQYEPWELQQPATWHGWTMTFIEIGWCAIPDRGRASILPFEGSASGLTAGDARPFLLPRLDVCGILARSSDGNAANNDADECVKDGLVGMTL
jgi:hypothetical protein